MRILSEGGIIDESSEVTIELFKELDNILNVTESCLKLAKTQPIEPTEDEEDNLIAEYNRMAFNGEIDTLIELTSKGYTIGEERLVPRFIKLTGTIDSIIGNEIQTLAYYVLPEDEELDMFIYKLERIKALASYLLYKVLDCQVTVNELINGKEEITVIGDAHEFYKYKGLILGDAGDNQRVLDYIKMLYNNYVDKVNMTYFDLNPETREEFYRAIGENSGESDELEANLNSNFKAVEDLITKEDCYRVLTNSVQPEDILREVMDRLK